MAGAIVDVTDAAFRDEVLGSSQPVVVDFWAAWCGPCRALAPVLETVARQYAGRVKFAKVDADSNPRVCTEYRVQGLPTLAFFTGGRKVGELVGVHPQAAITREIEALLARQSTVSRSSAENPSMTIVTCSQCGQKNRVPAARLAEAVCGRCHAALAPVPAGTK